MTPQQQLDAFLADIRQTNRFINIDRAIGTRSSIASLVVFLRGRVNNPQPMTVIDAVQRCAVPNAPGITKYLPAIQRLVSVWGYDQRDYPSVTGAVAVRAAENFYQHSRLVPFQDRVDYELLLRWSGNAAGFGVTVAPQGYVARLPNPNGGNLDITSRGLLLRSGLIPEANGFADRSYMSRLQLTQADLQAMANQSIADVGCGAAIFRAEMQTLFGCATTGLDFNAAQVPAGNAQVRSRYIRSILYLKMLLDTNRMNVTLTSPEMAPLIRRLVDNLGQILTNYVNTPPVVGDIFNLPAAMIASNHGHRWNYMTTMYLLCYFTPIQQTNAVLNMCGATTNAVYLYNGSGVGNGIQTQTLTYDTAQIRHAFPQCRILVKDPATHHIIL
ncbi:hypothetical protein [Bryobacter aggregatus]|uniref:hypothetical protein n=1 Tax=Bryobacter aggregatus TaxID=360054 RepID=UPI0004E153E2|nr:hypothetical protein [Bryobacter aggregatus]